MKLTVLTENVAGGSFLAEHGISYLLEIDGEKILWDTGHSDVFLKNAEKLGINIHSEIKKVVLSHGHWDHVDGLQHLENKILITHPSSFINRFRKTDHSPVGFTFTREKITEKFELIETTSPLKITENLWFLGEIPRENDFESQTTSFKDEFGNDDFIPDDSALAAVINNKLLVITGCSHSGICNIVEYAKKVTGISSVDTVIGGFHLKHNNLQTQKTIEYFKKNAVKNVCPSHCTDLPALAAFFENFKFQQVKTGMIFIF
ncbi:MBL fold metallo-hydrolase [Maribellus comscasis]|uniref:MBL fold metallo-hydrolase n=1 Tax=Maribellus comscasis TaxID=2681766 RepID=A0A6I6K0D3_9BACT|nr:MBL fold metallo-hydrolase [Maribellus comscasis]QGY46888.1 MBL fold metallo-hydrolase [Maribellus comscasis]